MQVIPPQTVLLKEQTETEIRTPAIQITCPEAYNEARKKSGENLKETLSYVQKWCCKTLHEKGGEIKLLKDFMNFSFIAEYYIGPPSNRTHFYTMGIIYDPDKNNWSIHS
jgi:hypothetical protein